MLEKEDVFVPKNKKKSNKKQTNLRKHLLKKVYDANVSEKKENVAQADSDLCLDVKTSKKPTKYIHEAVISVRKTAVWCKKKAIKIPWNIASRSKGILMSKNFPTFTNITTPGQCRVYEIYFNSIFKVWMSLTKCMLEYSGKLQSLKEAYGVLPKGSSRKKLKKEYYKEKKCYKESIVHAQFIVVQRQLVLLLILITKFDNSMCLQFLDNFKTLLKDKSYLLKNLT